VLKLDARIAAQFPSRYSACMRGIFHRNFLLLQSGFDANKDVAYLHIWRACSAWLVTQQTLAPRKAALV